VLKRSMDIALAGLVFSVSIPLLVISEILFKLDSESPAAFRPIRMRWRSRRVKPSKLKFQDEFAIESAIEAYEELIDSTFKQRRV
jgi:lipopolysaccharide/colanic/teichoic acid biosynthesis glycosyltransferase